MSRRSLIEKLDRVPSAKFDGIVLRSVSPGYSPLSGEGARAYGGRWNPKDSYPTLYTARDPATVALEIGRTARKLGFSVSDLLPRRLVTIRLAIRTVLDLTDKDVLASAGYTRAVLLDDDIRICQAIGDAAHYLGFEAIRAPSAAGPGETIAVFINRLGADSSLDVIANELIDVGDAT